MSDGRRLSIVLVSLLAIYLLVAWVGLDPEKVAKTLRVLVEQAGMWAWLVFAAGFIGGVVLQVPGVVFVVLAPVLFPPPQAWWLCILAGNLAVNLNFLLVRRWGGQPLTALPWPWAQRLLVRLEEKPLRSVFLLRTVFLMLPPVTGALALTRISTRAHMVGSFFGLLLPVSVILAAEWWLLG